VGVCSGRVALRTICNRWPYGLAATWKDPNLHQEIDVDAGNVINC
jgi:hypothetical protein